MKRIGFSVALLFLTLSLTVPVFGQDKGIVEHVKVHSKSLEGNLEGDSPDRDVFVYLPPSYSANRNQRYPVVYLLHGYGLTAERWMSFAALAELSDKDIAAGTMKEMILVNPDAHTIYDGSMYSASLTTGDWETYIAEDLVSYIDSHYHTIPSRMSRGLGGHSMGGYGTVRIGMKRPDVFSSLYIMSACCLLSNPYAQANRGAAPAATAAPVPPAAAGAGARGEQPAAGQRGQRGQGRGNAFANVGSAQAAAWASNPNNPPKYFDLPTKDGAVQPLIAAKYLANSPLVMIDQYTTNLKKYHAIMGDVGTQDSLAASNRQMDEIFTSLGIKHAFETYEGDHTNHVKDRFEQKVLPFFSNNLSFVAGKE
jgi:S-formylglutathione hydrolase